MLKLNAVSSKCLAVLITAIPTLMLVSCSSDDDESNSTQLPASFNSEWARDCRPNFDGATSSFIDIVTIEGINSERTRVTYIDSDCQLLLASTSYDVIIDVGESSVDASSGLTVFPVDLNVGEFRVTPATQELTDTYNESNLCGMSNYAVNETTVVSINCDFADFGNGVLFGLWANDGDLLYIGNESITDEERPTTLVFDNPFRRQ